MSEELILKDENNLKQILDAARTLRKVIMNDSTPKEYVKDKPMGKGTVTYVPASYMDNKFKENIPLYSNKFAFPPFVFQNWIIVGVEITDRLTGNIELGLKAHRIQFNSDKKKAVQAGTMRLDELTPFDMIDVGNDVSACLTEAIKNGQSRHGICADIYDKIVVSLEDIQKMEEEFKTLLSSIPSPLVKSRIKSSWSECKSPKEKLNYLNELLGEYNGN